MRISTAFPSDYLKAGDLGGRTVRVVMSHVEMKDIGDDHKPVLYFQGKDKGMVLNKTNANNITALYGDDTDLWSGREIMLFPAMVDFQGKTVEAIRIRAPQPKDNPQNGGPTYMTNGGVTEPPRQSAAPNDDIPF
jgi:molybdopterin converting factor small subunit